MIKMSAHETLSYIIQLFIEYLENLDEENQTDQFAYGERTAYVECLEIIQCWEFANNNGLDFDIEDKFPL